MNVKRVLMWIMVVVFVGSGNMWANGEQKSKGTAKQSAVALKQGNEQTMTKKQTQQKEEQKTEEQKDIQVKQDKTNKNKYYYITDELVCENVKIESIAKCPLGHKYPLWQLECEQELFVNGKSLNVKYGLSFFWGCVKDQKTSNYYVVIDFYSGGNCWDCEWTGVYDFEGNLIVDTLMDRTKCTLPRRREKTPDGFYDEFADCPEKLIKKREENIKKIRKLKLSNKEKFKAVNFEKED